MSLVPILQKAALDELDHQIDVAVEDIKVNAEKLSAAKLSFELATQETVSVKLEEWKNELSSLKEKMEELRVEAALNLD